MGVVGVKVGNVGAVSISAGKVGVNVGAVANISGVGQSEMPPPKVGVVGTGGVKVGAVGVKVGNVGPNVGNVGETGAVGAPSIIAVGQNETPPNVGIVGRGAVVAASIIAVGQNETPPNVGIVGRGAVVVGTGAVVGKITAKLTDEIKSKTMITHKPDMNNLSDLILKNLLRFKSLKI
ncbi:hypothetical protein JXL19_12670 [bacterium]|nr:hypothetical protein [bacterium]